MFSLFYEISSLKIYPNPVNGFLKIPSEETFEYQLFNVLGLKIASGKIKNELNTEGLEKGIYQINLTHGRESKVLMFIKD